MPTESPMTLAAMTTVGSAATTHQQEHNNNVSGTSHGIMGIALGAGSDQSIEPPAAATSLASLEFLYFKAVSFYRRRRYEKCTELCNAMLQAGHANNVQMFVAANGPDREWGADDYGGHNEMSPQQHKLLQHQQHQQQQTFHGSNMAAPNNYTNNNNNGIFGSGTNNTNNTNSNISSNLQRAAQRQKISGNSHNNNSNNNSNTAAANPFGKGFSNDSSHHSTMGNNHHPNNNSNGNNNNRMTSSTVVMPTWLMEAIWQLKMRALTQRIYVDDLETNDEANVENEEVEFERIATAARPGTSIKTAFVPRPRTSTSRSGLRKPGSAISQGGRNLTSSGRPLLTGRPMSGMARPGTAISRPGSAAGGRPASRCGTASRVRNTSAAAFISDDSTAALYQASRYNPTIYADRQVLVKALFQFVFYHEADVAKAFAFCEAVLECEKKRRPKNTTLSPDWWWKQQMGRCLLTLHYPRKAEVYLQESLAIFPHPDTYLLLSRVYQRLDKPDRALELITSAVDRHPFNITFRTEQGRIYDVMSKPDDAVQIYRLIAKLNPINIEALACIAVSYFYDNNPEMALMYYRRILSLGVHSPELYCNIALCCLYGGQIDLVLPCFQRALRSAETPEQKADIWYNLSFVALTTGDFNLGRRCLQLSLTSDAQNGAALNNLAVLSAHSGNLMKAKSYLAAAKDVSDTPEIESNLQYMEEHYKL